MRKTASGVLRESTKLLMKLSKKAGEFQKKKNPVGVLKMTQITPEDIGFIKETLLAMLMAKIVKQPPKLKKRAALAVALLEILLNLKVYVYEQKVPKDGHGPVVIIDENREFADMQFLNRFQKKWPKASAADQQAHLKNAKVTVKPVWPSIVLDDHGI